jgi:hypothetical protein
MYPNKKKSQQNNWKVKTTLKKKQEEGVKNQIMDIKKLKNKYQWVGYDKSLHPGPLHVSNPSTTWLLNGH